MPISLLEAETLATQIPSMIDDRPDALKALRDAEHPTTSYYRFLYELGRRYAPIAILEIGTYCGTSAAHLAAGSGNHVTTIDIQPDAKCQVDRLGYANIRAITGNSLGGVTTMFAPESFDVLYVDGWHDFNQTYGEYVAYRPLVRPGGLIIFDDVGLEMAGDEMEVFWGFVSDPKVRVDHLHPNTGFGFCQKELGRSVRPWADVIGEATQMIAARRA